MNTESIALKLQENFDSLYAELAVSTDGKVRTPLLPSKETINEGKKRFEEIKNSLSNVICSEKTMSIINSSEKKEGVIILIDIITESLSEIHFPVVTVACLIIKVGIKRICRGSVD